MCTVTYMPTADGFILTHNRDEAPSRSTQSLTLEKNAHRSLVFPRDAGAGGSWIACNNKGFTACLLNGAFVKHTHNPPYRRSRGLLLLDGMGAEKPGEFWREYDYSEIEPFTLLLFSSAWKQEMRWDGSQLHIKHLAHNHPYFWCSATLYPPDMQERRAQVFHHWLQQAEHLPEAEALLALHRTGSVNDPENDFVMNRNNRVRTVSITQVAYRYAATQIRYFDLLQAQEDVRRITLQP